ncbi:MAG: hypothetical protein U0946_00935 [Patescibacteria group bacterium]|nr:hypothetical protein [Patescibacteria group bacterium]
MPPYLAKSKELTGTNYAGVFKQARQLFKSIKARTKRRPYLRSVYFHKQKIFFDFFWQHLAQKRYPDRVRRLRYFPCAIELILKSRIHPESMDNPTNKGEILHRFSGMTKSNQLFYVHIKEDKRKGNKQLMSIFPAK